MQRLVVAFALIFIFTASTATAGTEFRYPPIHIDVTESQLNKDLHKDKDELLEASQILEDILHQSGAVHKDPALEEAIAKLIPLDQMGDKAKGFYFRVYLLKDPDVNAMTVPSGSIYVNSGLLAMLDNFEQLRAVMAHEAHHAIDQDIVYEFKRIKDQTGFLKMVNLLAAPAVAYAISESDSGTAKTIANVYTGASYAVSIAYQLSIYGYSRGHENECDEYAMGLFSRHGYNMQEIKRLFENFDNQHKKYSKDVFHTHLFATHETPKQRMDRVDKFAAKAGRQDKPIEVDRKYHELTKDLRIINARLNIRMGRIQHALDDLERLKAIFPDDARVMNAFGEAYSKLAEDRKLLEAELSYPEWKKIKKEKEDIQRESWIKEALNYFERSKTFDPLFADPYRGEAQLKESQKDYQKAIELYESYLAHAGKPKDQRYVQAKIERLKGILNKEKEKQAKEEERRNAHKK